MKKTKKTIRGVMGNSGEGKQFKPFDLSGNLTWKLFLKKKNSSEFHSFCTRSTRLRLQQGSFLLEEDYKNLIYKLLKSLSTVFLLL